MCQSHILQGFWWHMTVLDNWNQRAKPNLQLIFQFEEKKVSLSYQLLRLYVDVICKWIFFSSRLNLGFIKFKQHLINYRSLCNVVLLLILLILPWGSLNLWNAFIGRTLFYYCHIDISLIIDEVSVVLSQNSQDRPEGPLLVP